MATTRAAIRYAKAILAISNSKGTSSVVNEDMKSIATTLQNNKELTTFIFSPTITGKDKESVLLEVFSKANETTKSLFHLLLVNKRFQILKDIALEFSSLYANEIGEELVKVTTAFEMDASLEEIVLKKVATLSSKKIVLEKLIDNSIIGGFILTIGDKQYNASVANRLQQIKKELNK